MELFRCQRCANEFFESDDYPFELCEACRDELDREEQEYLDEVEKELENTFQDDTQNEKENGEKWTDTD